MNAIVRCYRGWIGVLEYGKPVLLLLLRVYFGVDFMIHGWGKLANIPTAAKYFNDLGIPMPEVNAYMAGATEFGCGALLVVGLGSRIFTIPLIVTMIVAYATAHRVEVFDGWQQDPWGAVNSFVKAAPFKHLVACLVVLLFGPGLFSVDGVVKWVVDRRDRLARNAAGHSGAPFGGADAADRGAPPSPGHTGIGVSDRGISRSPPPAPGGKP